VAMSGLPILQAGCLEQQAEAARWLIEGLWARSAIGLIGGAPKCAKTWFGLDMAISVASGTDALGHFPVVGMGPALIYLAEDALPQVRHRIDAICRQRGCDIDSLDLHVITAPSLRLDQNEDQKRLAETIDALRPQIVVLDPLVRLHRLDENSASEISVLLGYFRDLQRRFDTAIVIVHHASKKQRAQPGQSLRGSSDLHAIGDCNAYLARKGEKIILAIEHRAARSPDPMTLELVSDEVAGATCLCVCDESGGRAPDEQTSIEDRVIDTLAQAAGPLSRNVLRARVRVNNQKLGDVLALLQKQERDMQQPRHEFAAMEPHRALRALDQIDQRERQSLDTSQKREQRVQVNGRYNHMPSVALEMKPRGRFANVTKAKNRHRRNAMASEIVEAAKEVDTKRRKRVNLFKDFTRAARDDDDSRTDGKTGEGKGAPPMSKPTDKKNKKDRNDRNGPRKGNKGRDFDRDL
jgi:hypothetical protein